MQAVMLDQLAFSGMLHQLISLGALEFQSESLNALGEVWTDELPAYQGMEHDHCTVIHYGEYVSVDGVHTNQAKCL